MLLPQLLHSAAAQPVSAPLHYAAYIRGLNVITMQASVALSPQHYRMQVSYSLTGMVGALFSGAAVSTVDGDFQGNTPVPRELFSTGEFRGKPRVTRMQWRNGTPVIMELTPPVEEEREPVPAALQARTIDSLSAMVALLHQVAATGRCDGALTTFDGRRLSELRAQTVGEETLPATSRSAFQGTALRCNFEGRQLAGFLRNTDQDSLRRPQRGSAWFARVMPGGPPIPVRITFDLRSFGEATVYLTGPG